MIADVAGAWARRVTRGSNTCSSKSLSWASQTALKLHCLDKSHHFPKLHNVNYLNAKPPQHNVPAHNHPIFVDKGPCQTSDSEEDQQQQACAQQPGMNRQVMGSSIAVNILSMFGRCGRFPHIYPSGFSYIEG